MKIDPQHWPALSALLDQALELGPEERARWLQALSAGAQAYRETLSLLLADRARLEADDFLERGPAGRPRTPVVGPYRLLQEIGRGGMGLVWLAERRDGLLKRPVALKLPHAGLATQAFAERLARERDILASLNHPNIARLYDAGISADGQPYIALEYVAGRSLTEHCAAAGLGVKARLGLFLQVLAAVQYAHSQLVVHRDLKPSNVLVDEQGRVLLLDFGIAKLVTDGPAEATALTLDAGQPMSIDYAAPEQIAGAAVGTAADIYSLGVLLFELLVGERPYRLQRQDREGLLAALRSLPPARPSARAGGALARELRGDLDTIVQRAMAAAPDQRYATVQAMRDDLQRHLDGLPVLAQPDRWSYRCAKFVRRHRAGVAVAALLAVVIVGALAVSLWEAGEARAQAALAQRENRKAKAIEDFLLGIFRANSDEQANPAQARRTTARELLDIGARRVQAELKDAPESQIELLSTLSDMYYDLGLAEEAARMSELGVEARRRVYGPDSVEVAKALITYAGSLPGTRSRERILPALDEARRILDLHHDDSSHSRVELLIRYAQRYQNLSIAKMRDAADQALRVIRDHPESGSNLGTALHFAARARFLLGDAAGAEPLFSEALERSRNEGEGTYTQNAEYLADVQWRLQKFDAAEALLRSLVERGIQRSGAEHPNTLFSQMRLGLLLVAAGRVAEGRPLLDRTLQATLATLGEANTLETPAARTYSARGWLEQGEPAKADALLAQVIASNARHYPDSVVLANNLRDQALAWADLGRSAEAEAQLRRALAMHRAAVGAGAEPWLFNDHHLLLARLRAQQDDAAGAEAELAQVVPPQPPLPVPVHEVAARLVRSEIARRAGRVDEAAQQAQAALETLQRSPLRPWFAPLEAKVLAQRRLANAPLR